VDRMSGLRHRGTLTLASLRRAPSVAEGFTRSLASRWAPTATLSAAPVDYPTSTPMTLRASPARPHPLPSPPLQQPAAPLAQPPATRLGHPPKARSMSSSGAEANSSWLSSAWNEGQVILGGAAMSKSTGNPVVPGEVYESYGADTLRGTPARWRGLEVVEQFDCADRVKNPTTPAAAARDPNGPQLLQGKLPDDPPAAPEAKATPSVRARCPSSSAAATRQTATSAPADRPNPPASDWVSHVAARPSQMQPLPDLWMRPLSGPPQARTAHASGTEASMGDGSVPAPPPRQPAAETCTPILDAHHGLASDLAQIRAAAAPATTPGGPANRVKADCGYGDELAAGHARQTHDAAAPRLDLAALADQVYRRIREDQRQESERTGGGW
jgi:hypothetical protein